MTSLTLLPTSRASSGGRGQSAASAAAGSERERGGGVGGDAAGSAGSAAASSERERGGGVGVERVAGTADARDWRAVGGAAEEPGEGESRRGEGFFYSSRERAGTDASHKRDSAVAQLI